MTAWVVARVSSRGASRSRASSIAKMGSVIDSETSFRPTLNGPAVPTRTSAASRKIAPPAIACTVAATTTGFGESRTRR